MARSFGDFFRARNLGLRLTALLGGQGKEIVYRRSKFENEIGDRRSQANGLQALLPTVFPQQSTWRSPASALPLAVAPSLQSDVRLLLLTLISPPPV